MNLFIYLLQLSKLLTTAPLAATLLCAGEQSRAEKTPSSLRAQNTHTHSPGSHQLIQSSVSHCYTHGQQKATRILINNVIHPGLRALNPGILAACFFFSLSLFLEIPGKMLRAFFYTVELMQLDLMHTDPRAFCSTSDVHIQMQYVTIFPGCKKKKSEIP